SGPPMTISTFQQMESWDLTLEEAIELTLRNSKVLQKLGGVVVNSPAGAQTLYDVAINETNPQGSVEAALSQFDAQIASSLFLNHSERFFNNPFFGGGADTLNTNSGQFRWELVKPTAAGTRFAVRNLTDYTRNNSPFNTVPSVWDTVNQFEIRQPLLRGSGVQINRIAGPGAQPGQYNGVLIARIRSDLNLADFEAGLRDLVRDVERNYWELYYAYRELDTRLAARDATRAIWENRQLVLEAGKLRPDEEAQARQQYYQFQLQAQSSLTGNGVGGAGFGSGVLGAERNLRRLMGLTVNDGRILRPISEPAIAPIVFDWEILQQDALTRSVNVRRQKWTIKQRELELIAAKQLNMWDLDAVGQYGFRGFGDDLFGNRSVPQGSAVADLWHGDLDDWQMGVQLQGPIGNRLGHIAVRNAELRLIREKTVLREQQRQLLHDLSASYVEVDRALEAIKLAYNGRVAAYENLDAKRIREREGLENVFFLLDAQQRLATAESSFYRSLADYNLALMNLTYTAGGLLDRYNIFLEEGDWDSGLQLISDRKAGKMVNAGPNPGQRDLDPVTNGPFPQSDDSLPAGTGELAPETEPTPGIAPEEQQLPGTVRGAQPPPRLP
ncbi:MAG: TolC family protein, partial [Planctomycetota bacterium]